MKAAWYRSLNSGKVLNIFNATDPEFHSIHRRLLSPPLSDTSLRLFEPIISARISLAIDKMKEEMKPRGAADVFKWWSFMATDIIAELTFGDSFRMLEQGKVSLVDYMKTLSNVYRKIST
jgi:cytochrome P450